MSKTGIEDLSFSSFLGAAVVILLLIDVYVKVMAAIKTHREEKKRKDAPVNSLEETVKSHDEKLKKDNERLKELEEGNRIMMRAMMALLSHDINGNSNDKLTKSLDEIQQFLINK